MILRVPGSVAAVVRLLAMSCCAFGGESRAAGGHLAVDDAALLDRGECQVETWFERQHGGRTLLHVGPACRVGAVELGLNGDRQGLPGESPSTVVGAQVKWVHALDERTSVGVVALAGWLGRGAQYAGAAIYAPLTVQVAEGLRVHANVGRDWTAHLPATSRAGVALEWQALPEWSLTGEAFRQSGLNIARLAVRWQPSAGFSVDASGAGGRGAAPGPWWTIGANWTFAR